MTASRAFSYSRRVQFAETDASGIVHFSCMFRYMEEAEHALWRAAGLTIAGRQALHGWPRVSVAFEYHSPLSYADEFVVNLRLEEVGRRSLRYAHEIVCAQTIVGTGVMVTVCVRTSEGGTLHAVEIPADVIPKLRMVLDRERP